MKKGGKPIELKDLSRHTWISKRYNPAICLGELIEVVDPSSSSHSKFEENKMSRIFDQIGLILQNVNSVDLTITGDSKGVEHLAYELGMMDKKEQVVADLKRVYKAELK